MTLPGFVFWACLVAVAWSYVGYGWWLRRAAARAPALAAPEADGDGALPQVGVIVSAFNEERHIRARILNLLAQDYPADRLHVYVGSDGSRDRTVAEAEAVATAAVTVRDFKVNRGKASVLNDLVAQSREPILVFTDANTEFDPQAIRRLVAHFAVPGVGAVSGALRLHAPGSTGSNQDHVYWAHEQQIKQAEDRIDALLGANGGIYAIRRELTRPLDTDTVCDDFIMVMNAAAAGARVRYEATAIAYEDVPADMAEEYQRRVRIGIGNYQALFRHPEYLLGGHAARRIAYFSHKVLRWVTPHLVLLAGLAAAVMATQGSTFFATLLVLGLVGSAFAWLVFSTRDRVRWPGIVGAATFVAMLNLAFLVGSFRYVTGRYRGSWARSERGGPAPGGPASGTRGAP